jgi:L-cystine transport system permease protein
MDLNTEYMINTFKLALGGIPVTMEITIVTLLFAIPVSFWFSIAKIYRLKFISQFTTLYVSFVRGTPIVLQILIIYSLVPSLLNNLVVRSGLKVNVFDLNPIWYAFVVFGLNTTAVLTEVFRSAILTVDKGQIEAALSTGLTNAQAYRRIVIPQALLVALPNLCNATIGLIKGTSLAFLMTVKDITAIAKVEASYGYNYIESYLDIFAIYIIVCVITQLIFMILEKKIGIYRAPIMAL